MVKSVVKCAAAITAAALSVSCGSGNASQEVSYPSSVLVVVDVQRDFFSPDGSLYVQGSEALPAKIAQIAGSYDAVIFTLDWHPGNHCSFKEYGGIWPSHCVAFTQGAGLADEFSPLLAMGEDKVQLYLKGADPKEEQYGAFEGLESGLVADWLRNADKVAVCGIAGDYCVKESTANILKLASAEKVVMLLDCIRSIDDGSALSAFISENHLGVE